MNYLYLPLSILNRTTNHHQKHNLSSFLSHFKPFLFIMVRLRGLGRRKTAMKAIENEGARDTCFSKRRRGLFNKAAELSTLCGSELALVVYSPAGNPYSFGTPNVDQVIKHFISDDNNGENSSDPTSYGVVSLNNEYMELMNSLDAEKQKTDDLEERISLVSPNPLCRMLQNVNELTEDELVLLMNSLEQLEIKLDMRTQEMKDNEQGESSALSQKLRSATPSNSVVPDANNANHINSIWPPQNFVAPSYDIYALANRSVYSGNPSILQQKFVDSSDPSQEVHSATPSNYVLPVANSADHTNSVWTEQNFVPPSYYDIIGAAANGSVYSPNHSPLQQNFVAPSYDTDALGNGGADSAKSSFLQKTFVAPSNDINAWASGSTYSAIPTLLPENFVAPSYIDVSANGGVCQAYPITLQNNFGSSSLNGINGAGSSAYNSASSMQQNISGFGLDETSEFGPVDSYDGMFTNDNFAVRPFNQASEAGSFTSYDSTSFFDQDLLAASSSDINAGINDGNVLYGKPV